MLAAQTKSLAELVEIQKAQNEQIEQLQQQNERIIGALPRPGQHTNSFQRAAVQPTRRRLAGRRYSVELALREWSSISLVVVGLVLYVILGWCLYLDGFNL